MSIGDSDSCKDNCRGYVSEELVEETEDGYIISSFCKYLEVERHYLERNYKSISAEPLDGYYLLHAGPITYYCEYLDIDGIVFCDNRESEVS